MAHLVYLLDKYSIRFDDQFIEYKTYEEDYCRGITFVVDDWTYHLVFNYAMGARLLMTSKAFHWKDIPFKEDTFDFLPPGVKAMVNDIHNA